MLRFITPRCLWEPISLTAKTTGIECTAYKCNRTVALANASTSASVTDDLPKIFNSAKELTLEAGKLIQRGLEEKKHVETKGEPQKNLEKKGVAWDLVTNYDKQVEEFLISRLSKEFPDHKFIAEESSAEDTPITDAPTWFIDPIDGTTNFIHNFPMLCISVGFSIKKEVMLGIVYNPANSEIYTAKKGEGAFFNGKQIYTSKVTKLSQTLMLFEPSVMRTGTTNRDVKTNRIHVFIDQTRGLRNVGSAALSLAYVARGIVDCFHLDGFQSWDVAAGMLILHEAGGATVDVKGRPYDITKTNIIAASTQELAQEAAKLLVETDLKTYTNRLKKSNSCAPKS